VVGGGLRFRHPDAKKPVVTGELWAGKYLLKLLSPNERQIPRPGIRRYLPIYNSSVLKSPDDINWNYN
jgi:hypothetical protein